MRDTSAPLARRKRVKLWNGPKSFTHFPLLPTELRHLVYSKMPLYDRVIAAKSSTEAEAYFKNYPINSDIRIGLAKVKKNVYVKVRYLDAHYMEMHKVPDELTALVDRDIKSSVRCRSSCCDERYSDIPDVHFRYYDNGLKFADDLLSTLNCLVEIESLVSIKSAPVGGLVDLFQPSLQLSRSVTAPILFSVDWHLQKNVDYERNDEEICVENWRRWLGSSDAICHCLFASNLEDAEEGSEQRFAYIPNAFFDFPLLRNATLVTFIGRCTVDISAEQLMAMKARNVSAHGFLNPGSNRLTEQGLLEFHKMKLKQWFLFPEREFEFFIKSEVEGTSTTPLYLNRDKLLEDVGENLESPDFRMDSDFLDLWRAQRPHRSCVLIEHVKSKKALEINAKGIFVVDDPRTSYDLWSRALNGF